MLTLRTPRLDRVVDWYRLQEYVSSLQQQVGNQEKELQQLKADKHMAQRVNVSNSLLGHYFWDLVMEYKLSSPLKKGFVQHTVLNCMFCPCM